MAYVLILSVCVMAVVVCVMAAALSENVRNAVISSGSYKRAFAAHINLFSRLYNKAVRKHKEELFARMEKKFQTVQGDKLILEVGVGTGANFEFLPRGSSLIALDPNSHMEHYLMENAKRFSHFHLEKIVCGRAENMDAIPDESIDVVVCTLTLCSVEDMEAALAEIMRVLKPGGHFYFLEHVAAEAGTWRKTLQRTFDNQWKYFSDGCSCMRETLTFIENAGFSEVDYLKFFLKGFWIIGYLMRPHVVGYAVK